MPPTVGWYNTGVSHQVTSSSTGTTTYSATTAVNSYVDSWLVQYVDATYSAQQWQIVRANPWSYWTGSLEDPRWEPAAPAVIRGRQEASRRAQERVVAELERTARQVEERRQAAAARARQLLLGELDPVQRAQFEAEGHFVVIGRRGGRYRIRPAVSANIDTLDRRGRVTGRLCVHPQRAYDFPVEDVMLAQLLHLRDDERALLRIANRHPAPRRLAA
jgi:hypothetical protein